MTDPQNWSAPWTASGVPPAAALPARVCPVCGGKRSNADQPWSDELRISHANGCRLGTAEDATAEADYQNVPRAIRGRMIGAVRDVTAAELEILLAWGFVDEKGAAPTTDTEVMIAYPSLSVRRREFPTLSEPGRE